MTTDFSQIIFDASEHTYTYQGHRLTGANRKIKEIQQPFNREQAAQRVSERQHRTVEDILTEWTLKGDAGKQKGVEVHEHIMKVLTGDNGPVEDPFLVVNKPLPEITAFNDVWTAIRPDIILEPDFVEWVIGDQDLAVAGTLDTMFYSHKTELLHIWDWKTGKFEHYNRFQNLLPPFQDLHDCQMNVFSLVTSLYRLMVERNRPDLSLGDPYLVHLSSSGHYQIHRAFDFRVRLLAWLEQSGSAI